MKNDPENGFSCLQKGWRAAELENKRKDRYLVMKQEYIEKIYAGWLAKIIGIRLGAPIEGWTYEKIKNIYGELTD